MLYLSPQDYPCEPTRDRWADVGASASLRIATIDNLVTHLYERSLYKGRVTHVDQPLLFRLAELGVETLETSQNPFYTTDRLPRAGLVEQAESLFTELESAGLLSADAMEARLREEGLGTRAAHVGELATAIQQARDTILADELADTYRTERMHRVTTMDEPWTDLSPSIDAVVLSGFTRFDALTQRFLARLVDTWPTTALLPMHGGGATATGVDAGVKQAFETYQELGFTPADDGNESVLPSDRHAIAQSLFRHPEQSPDTEHIDPAELEVMIVEPETVPDELTTVARDLRASLDESLSPDDVGVVLTNPVQYADQVGELFDAYEIPHSLQTGLPLTETALGGVIETMSELREPPRTVDTLLDLLTNPLVSLSHAGGELDHASLTEVPTRLDSTRLESALTHVDGDIAATVDSLLRDIEALADAPLEELPGQLDALFERLGVTAALEDDDQLSSQRRSQEQEARSRLERVVETLVTAAPLADPERGDTVQRLKRALTGVSLQQQSGTPEGRVVVCGLPEALPHAFDQVYLLGLTASHTPSDPERMAFTQPIYDSHPDFEQRDVAAETRHHLGCLLGSQAALTLTVPQRETNGEPFVEAELLTELSRVIDTEAITTDSLTPPPGTQEDVQRALAEPALASTEFPESAVDSLLDRAVAVGTFTEAQRGRMNSGLACAAARADPGGLTPYDGQLTPETVSMVHDESRESHTARVG